jgi:hypothetical protein
MHCRTNAFELLSLEYSKLIKKIMCTDCTKKLQFNIWIQNLNTKILRILVTREHSQLSCLGPVTNCSVTTQ